MTRENYKLPPAATLPALGDMDREAMAQELAFWRAEAAATAETLAGLFVSMAKKQRGESGRKAISRLKVDRIYPLIATVDAIRHGKLFHKCRECQKPLFPGTKYHFVNVTDEDGFTADTEYRCIEHRLLGYGDYGRMGGDSVDLDLAIDKLSELVDQHATVEAMPDK